MMTLLIESALKSTLILGASWIAVAMLRSAASDLRHRVWLAGLIAVAILPVALTVAPQAAWAVPVSTVPVAAMAVKAELAARRMPWLAMIWAAGVALVMGRLGLGILRVWIAGRRAIARDGVLWSEEIATPLTWGFLRPQILVPQGDWTEDQLAMTLEHERAHVARHDWLWQTIARMISAVFWFHPLVWLAEAAMRREAEQAVDDLVLRAGTDPREYAEGLLAIARRMSGRAPAASVAMVRAGALETRVKAILDSSRPRGRASGWARATVAAIAIGALLPLAAFQDPGVHRMGEPGLAAPKVLSKVDPVYTPEARDAKIEGTVVLKCVIGEDGRAGAIEVTRSLDAGLDTNAMAALAQWQFEPGRKDGKPVKVQATIEVNFRLL